MLIAAHKTILSMTYDDCLKDMSSAQALKAKVTIDDDVLIESNVVILPKLTIRGGTVIGAGAVVTK